MAVLNSVYKYEKTNKQTSKQAKRKQQQQQQKQNKNKKQKQKKKKTQQQKTKQNKKQNLQHLLTVCVGWGCFTTSDQFITNQELYHFIYILQKLQLLN